MITLESVLLEAENIDGSPEAASKEDDDNAATDYTDSGDEDMDADTGETTGEDDPGANEGDDAGTEDEGSGDDDPGPDEGTDYTEDEGTSDDDSTDNDMGDDTTDDAGMDNGDAGGDTGIESEDQIKQRDASVKAHMLLCEFNKLYHTIKDFITKVTTMDKKNLLFSAVQKTVVDNFDKMATMVYDYVMYYYDHMTYEYNLYTYNYFIEMCKVNIELMNKVATKDDVDYE